MLKYLANITKEGQKRKLTGKDKRIISAVAIIMSLYQLWQSTFSSIQPLLHYSIHLTFILVLGYMLYTPYEGCDITKIPKHDYLLAIMAALSGIYYATQIPRYLLRWPQVDPLLALDIVAGIIIVLFVIELTKRTMGSVLPSIGVIFLLYALFGHLIPGYIGHRRIVPIDVLDQLVFTTNGVFTSPIVVASTYVFLFVLFGSFFANSGAGDFFYKFSMSVAGRYTGGAGKVAVVASALFGMINGSPTANVVTTGSFTIPMMKKVGYDSKFAGAVNAVAATGGGIMPPIMGTAAFLMVEMAGIPYIDIAVAAALPGILFYLALGFMVHFRAKKLGLTAVDPKDLPPVGKTLKEGFPFILPLVVLVAMLIKGYTPSLAAVAGIVSVIAASFFRKETRMSMEKILKSLEDGALQSVIVSLSCAIAGIVINGLMITGLGGKIASLVLSVGGGNIFGALLITAVLCTILGMGMPVAAAYALTVSLAVPSLYELGIPPMPAHMFVVYFSTLSAITPPVAVAAYAAAGIAEANASKVGWYACWMGIVSFIVPFIFIYQPVLLINIKTFSLHTLFVMFGCMLGVIAMAAGMEGWLRDRAGKITRIALFISGLMMLYPETMTTVAGLIVFAAIYAYQRIKIKNNSLAA
ncbi:TRAP transporter permease [Lutispora saccharofermentans]|uniref:TRAP transporter permease n=1 Tax=Lutispora saccharofermentans TaxID=3024236 RepID=A0ABT1NED6_9FIRM|nr:TRAP transporter permease [Lutispora saccharofermentans]MCQ1529615.1 TRAP transporter permease [Lutispora saccharofermentans]